jgi:ubiquinone/menaquinone biosynthesis C-methylase UbiE
VSERMLDLAGLRLGMRVLDLATGRGEPAVRAAHRVGPTGVVGGGDCSEGLLQMARERAAREGVSNLDLRALNAERLEGIPMAHFHVTLARWGLMYFDSPIAALSAARCAMVRHGILVAAQSQNGFHTLRYHGNCSRSTQPYRRSIRTLRVHFATPMLCGSGETLPPRVSRSITSKRWTSP